MTHSLHRLGSIESLKQDYVVLTFHNIQGSFFVSKEFFRQKLPSLYAITKKILSRLGVLAALGRKASRPFKEEIKKAAVFTSKGDLCNYLKRLKEANTGRSVVVSGLIDDVNDCLKELGICFHTVQFSLGFFGKKDLLPKEEILEITTMCGHHLIAPGLVEYLANQVNKGVIEKNQAAEAMGKICLCDIFNKTRCANCLSGIRN